MLTQCSITGIYLQIYLLRMSHSIGKMPSHLQPYTFSIGRFSYTKGILEIVSFLYTPKKGILVFGFRRASHRKEACHWACWHRKPRGYSYNFDKGRYDPLCHRIQCSCDKFRVYGNKMEFLFWMRKSSVRVLTQW